EIQRMQSVDDVSRGILRHGFDIDGIAVAIDDRRRGDPVWTDVAAQQVRGRSFSTQKNPDLPKDNNRTAADTACVHHIHTVVFNCHIQNVFVSLSRYNKLAYEESLPINLTIDREFADLSKRRRTDVAHDQHRFLQVLSRSLDVVMMSDYVRS